MRLMKLVTLPPLAFGSLAEICCPGLDPNKKVHVRFRICCFEYYVAFVYHLFISLYIYLFFIFRRGGVIAFLLNEERRNALMKTVANDGDRGQG